MGEVARGRAVESWPWVWIDVLSRVCHRLLSLSLPLSSPSSPLPSGLRIALLSLSSLLPSPPPFSRPVRAFLTSSAGPARPSLPDGAPSYHLVVWQRHHLTFPTSPPPPHTITSALALKPLLYVLSPLICIVLCWQPSTPRILPLWTTTSTLRTLRPLKLCLLKTDTVQDARSRLWMRTEALWSRSAKRSALCMITSHSRVVSSHFIAPHPSQSS
ncbi:hypothetical protein C8Q73DRAFT_58365 [Cubamyces lactineus]|nr:hypothetical protein C8Q73DRAFT_58365 [Cubamyces lactineus]